MMRKMMTAICLGAVLALSTAAFAETEGEASAPQTGTEAAAEEEIKTIGTREEGAYEVRVKNATGRDIIKVAIRKEGEVEFSTQLLSEEDVFLADEERILCFKGEDAAETENAADAEAQAAEAEDAQKTDEAAEEEKVITPAYDLQITFKDDNSTAEIHAFPFTDAESAEIWAQDGVAFLKYMSKINKAEVDTKEAEIAIRDQAVAGALKAQPAQEAASGTAQTSENSDSQSSGQSYSYEEPAYEPVYEEPAYDEPVYEEPDYDEPSYDEPSYDEPADDEGGEDPCLEDGLTF